MANGKVYDSHQERMRLLNAGCTVPCPFCKKGKIRKIGKYRYSCDNCGRGICVDGEDIMSDSLYKIMGKKNE